MRTRGTARLARIVLNRTAAGPVPVSAAELAVAEAVGRVVVDQTHCLHERVADGRAHETESPGLEILAKRVRFRGAGRQLAEPLPAIHPGGSADESPDVRVKAPELALHGEERPRVRDRALDLEPVAHDPRVSEQPGRAGRGVPRDPGGVEAREHLAIARALLEDRFPAEARLRAFEGQELEERALVVNGDAPLGVVVGDAKLGARPAAARQRAHLLVPLATFFFRGRRLP